MVSGGDKNASPLLASNSALVSDVFVAALRAFSNAPQRER